MLFCYADKPHRRRHGPRGYRDYRSFKPWLRDEFHFRCVYCLCRERWFPDGDNSFSVDHLYPQRNVMQRIADYNNLVYACCQCNAAKRDIDDVIDPCKESFALHLEISDNGSIQGLTPEGWEMIKICRLDRSKLTAFRQGMIELFHELEKRKGSQLEELRGRFFGIPANLPSLSTLKPPAGNARPLGVEHCYFERQQRGKSFKTF
jgi:hypothetical protein